MILLLAALAVQDDVKIEVRARAWFAQFEGITEADGDVLQGSQIDYDNLGIDAGGVSPNLELMLLWPYVGRFTLDYAQAGFEGEETTTTDVVFEDGVFPAGTVVEGSQEFRIVSLTYAFELHRGDSFRLEVDLQGLYFTSRTEVDGGGVSAERTFDHPLLLPGIRAEADVLPDVTATLWVRGISFKWDDVSLDWVEFNAAIEARPWAGFVIGGGYRLFALDVDDQSDTKHYDLEGTLDGVYLSLGWVF
jgi:hypothetical protein